MRLKRYSSLGLQLRERINLCNSTTSPSGLMDGAWCLPNPSPTIASPSTVFYMVKYPNTSYGGILLIQPFYPFSIVSQRSSPRLSLGSAAADALGLGTLEMRGGDPALIVCLRSRGDSRAISTDDGNLVSRVDLLGLTRGPLRTLTTFATAALLREEGGDPGVVDEVDGPAKSAEEDEVQKDNLRVEEASGGLDDADSFVVDGHGVEGVLAVGQDSNELQTQILGMELGGEGVGHGLIGASGDLK